MACGPAETSGLPCVPTVPHVPASTNTVPRQQGGRLRARSSVLAGAVNLSGSAALYWRVELRSKGPGRARPDGGGDHEQVFRDAAPALWRAIYAFAAGHPAVGGDALAGALAPAPERAR